MSNNSCGHDRINKPTGVGKTWTCADCGIALIDFDSVLVPNGDGTYHAEHMDYVTWSETITYAVPYDEYDDGRYVNQRRHRVSDSFSPRILVTLEGTEMNYDTGEIQA